ncbi:hypothetical protein, partial [Escherichia coli]|uniref:hypothetical protein n=1 Tax=Escherichia coli TaxID=562 RepID=UPI000BE2E777
LPGSLQGKISSDGCLKKEQMVVSAIASTPHSFIQINISSGLHNKHLPDMTTKTGAGLRFL